MSIHADDLPAKVRKQLGIDAPKATKKSRAGVGLAEPCPGHCGCGQPFATAAAWERHAKKSGCRNWRIDLPIGHGPG